MVPLGGLAGPRIVDRTTGRRYGGYPYLWGLTPEHVYLGNPKRSHSSRSHGTTRDAIDPSA